MGGCVWPVASGSGGAPQAWPVTVPPSLGPRGTDHHEGCSLYDDVREGDTASCCVWCQEKAFEHPMVQVRLCCWPSGPHTWSSTAQPSGLGGPPLCRTLLPPAPSPHACSRLLAWCQGKGLQPPPFMGKPCQDRSLLLVGLHTTASQARHSRTSWADGFSCQGALGDAC